MSSAIQLEEKSGLQHAEMNREETSNNLLVAERKTTEIQDGNGPISPVSKTVDEAPKERTGKDFSKRKTNSSVQKDDVKRNEANKEEKNDTRVSSNALKKGTIPNNKKESEGKMFKKNKLGTRENTKINKRESSLSDGIEERKRKSKTDKAMEDNKIDHYSRTKESHVTKTNQSSHKNKSEKTPKQKTAANNKTRKGSFTKTVYKERKREVINLKMKRESLRETRSSLLMLEDPILEESEEEGQESDDENTCTESVDDSPDFKAVTSVIISPRQDAGSIQPLEIDTVTDPRNGIMGAPVCSEDDDEVERTSYKTNLFSPDFFSRDDVFLSDYDDTGDISLPKIEKKKKKKKTKKMKKLERKERQKRRRAKMMYDKIRGYADSIYESESLTISIKRERKIRLDKFIPDHTEKKKKKFNKKRIAAVIKKVQQTLDTFKKKQQDIQENLKKLESKKDKDAKPIMETLYEQLRETEQLYQQALGELKDVQEDLGKKLGKKEDKPESQEPSRSERSPSRKLNLSPDEQELTYELKAQLMRNIEMQNQKLKTELTLHEKMNESKLLNQQNRKLHEDSTLSRTNTLRLMKMFEKKAKDADEKLKEMQRELHKSQQLTKKYQQLLELEKRKLGGVGSGHVTPVSTGDEGESPRVPHPSSYSLLGGNVRVNDIIRKNEVLIEENGNLRREIQRLKQDNATLIKKTKHAMSDKDEIIKRIQTLCAENARMQNQLCKERSQHRLETANSRNRTLSRDLSREKTQHNMLSRSLTRQASDWIMLKKQLAQFDEEYKWSQVGPVNPTGAEERTYHHQAPRNIYMPRKMYPVENYAQPNHNT